MTDDRLTPGIVSLAAHARAVPSEAREAFADRLAAVAADPRAILVRTCHRAEIYLVRDGPTADPLDELRLPGLPPGGVRLEDRAAVRHLLSVAAGLDSVVVGEDQILHQLRECLSDRHPLHVGTCAGDTLPGLVKPSKSLHPVLERLFQIALRVGRETRSWREGPPRSLADVALDRIEAAGHPVLGRSLLVVGAGRMARLAALAAARRGAHVLVMNRSADRAAALAYDASGEPVAFGPEAPLPQCDAVVVAISGLWPLGDAARATLVAGSAHVVDLSSPPAIDAGLRAALRSRHTSVDDLAHRPSDAIRRRTRTRFERLLDDTEAEFVQWTRARAAVPAIRALSDRAEQRRAEELDRLFRRVALPDRERALVEQMSHRLVAGILHTPLAVLHDDTDGELERAARTLFSL